MEDTNDLCNICGGHKDLVPNNYTGTWKMCNCIITEVPTGMMGWICPTCGAGNSPFNGTCPCKQKL